MTRQDEEIRHALTDGMAHARIDTANLSIEVVDRAVIIKGTVPSAAQRDRLARLVSTSPPLSERTLQWQVSVADQRPA